LDKRLLWLMCLLAIAGFPGENAVATPEEEVVRPNEPDCSSRARCEKVDSAHLTILDLTISKDTIEGVQSRLGVTKPLPKAEPHDWDRKVCYKATPKSDGTVLLFGTSRMQLAMFSIISSRQNFKWRAECRESPLVSRSVSTKSGIRLGLSASQLKAMLGKPTEETKRELKWVFETRKPMTDKEMYELAKSFGKQKLEDAYWYVNTYLEATFVNSELMSVQIARTVTY